MTREVEDKIERSRTNIFKVVFPNTTNHYDTLFGGTAMNMMDEAAFIAATRFSRKKVVTVSSDKIDFKEPIPAGTIVELVAEVIAIGNTSLRVRVDLFQEEMYNDTPQKRSISGIFTFVALDNDNKKTRIL
ncbi:MAG: acyl-CoA thioesterase [Chitinophagaceae bacterium]|nr:acyl-CoA thioesterase [Chitinophagaceae bacterium]